MSTPPPGGGGGGIIDNHAIAILNAPNVQAMLPGAMVRNEVCALLARGCDTWTDDDRWIIGQAVAWAICNVK